MAAPSAPQLHTHSPELLRGQPCARPALDLILAGQATGGCHEMVRKNLKNEGKGGKVKWLGSELGMIISQGVEG